MHKPTLTFRRLALVALVFTVGATLLRFVPGPEPWPDWFGFSVTPDTAITSIP